MILTFLLGVAAGFATPFVEPFVRDAIAKIALDEVPISDREFDLLTLVLLLLLAALLTGGGSSLALLVGALVGVFGKRIVAAIQGKGGDA